MNTMNRSLRTLRPFLVSLALALATAHAPSHAQPAPKVLKKVAPEFPEEAVRKQVTDGVLKARVVTDAQGSVTEVSIVDAAPFKARVFTASAIAALKQWRFEPSGKAETFELKIVFQQE